MSDQYPKETIVETHVTYSVEVDGHLIIVEHVPARVCQETGEQFFAPETVQKIHQIIHGGAKPVRTVQTPVYEFAA